MEPEKQLSEKESLDLIAMMINKAKDSYRDTGMSAILWGCVITVCSLVTFSEIHFSYSLPVNIYWLTLVAVIPQIFISIREKRLRKVRTYDDVYMEYVWLAFGISVFLISFITSQMSAGIEPMLQDKAKLSAHEASFLLNEYFPSLYLLLYGFPTFVTGAACKVKPMLWGGILCWVCCIITLYTPLETDLLLIAFSAIVAWLIPGILMKRDYRKAKKELAASNV